MAPNFESCYISCGCNRTPHSADWGRNGLICFGCCNSVIIYDPTIAGEGGKIIHTLHSHKGRVNCVRWLKNNVSTPEVEFISASADETAIVWIWNNKTRTYMPQALLKGHKNIITIADGLIRVPPNHKYIPSKCSLLLGTASIDSTVLIWEYNKKEEAKCVDVINWHSGFCLDIKFTILPHTDIALLACAADDSKVHLFAELKKSEICKAEPEHKFYKIHVLDGHEDWVRAMDFLCDEKSNLFLATGSQDTYIRVYKLKKKTENRHSHTKLSNNSNTKEALQPEEKIIKVGLTCSEHQFAITLETVLAGHEGWVYGVCWHPPSYNVPNESSSVHSLEISGGFKSQKIILLSSSLDKSIIVWSPNKSGIWTEEVRVGEVGGNMLGFYGGKFGPGGKSILGHGYQGSFHIWSYDKENKNWEPKVVVGGHTADVMDLTWDIKGDFVLSVGSDQTTRLHAPWVRNEREKITWHEIARPQIHGYDLKCITMISEYKFASGAEEKVIRAFTAPNNFVENFKRISDVKINTLEIKIEGGIPQGAAVPALGLSNKPVFEQMKKEGFLVDDEYPDLYFSPIYLKKPPTEENLMQNTLWPEAQKLYGHGYEIYSLAARSDGVLLASSCKAASPDHAAIILWNAKTWLQVQKLLAHQLTVTQLSFSPNGHYLLSVSRDRKWTLFGVNEDGKSYQQLASSDGQSVLHTRIIWACSWTFDSLVFATGSRDGKIGFWRPVSSDGEVIVNQLTQLELPKSSVTALAFAPLLKDSFHILAVGLENGSILLYKFLNSTVENLQVIIQGDHGHDLTVKRIAFRPKIGRAGVEETHENNSNVLQLASCGSDHIIKIYDLFLDQL